MNLNSLNPPYFHILVGSEEESCQYAYRLNYEERSEFAVRLARGSKMKRVNDLFNEFAAAFQFPCYFGENWAAFDECLRDLTWLPAKGYILVIPNTASVLQDEPADIATFLRTLDRVCSSWASEPHAEFPSKLDPTPFHVLFQATESQVEFVRGILSANSSDPEVVSLKKNRAT
jgi:hypothetical protein